MLSLKKAIYNCTINTNFLRIVLIAHILPYAYNIIVTTPMKILRIACTVTEIAIPGILKGCAITIRYELSKWS